MNPKALSPLSTLLAIWAAGGVVTVEGDRLMVTGATGMCDELREAIRHHKPALLAAMRLHEHDTRRARER